MSVLRRLAARAQTLSRELAALEQELAEIASELAPELLAECGVGPICAAQLLVSSGDANRMRSESSFAALAGTSPVEASSGPIRRHRLNRGGDRRANNALFTIVLVRMRHDPATRVYVARRHAEGKTGKEIIRCLKRYVAREVYKAITNPVRRSPHRCRAATTPPPPGPRADGRLQRRRHDTDPALDTRARPRPRHPPRSANPHLAARTRSLTSIGASRNTARSGISL